MKGVWFVKLHRGSQDAVVSICITVEVLPAKISRNPEVVCGAS